MLEFTKRLLEELEKEGIEAEEITVVKNGCECTGIRLVGNGDEQLCPVVYYSQEETLADIVCKVKTVVEQDKPQINVKQLTDRNYVLSHAGLSIVKKGNNDLVKRPILNLEAIVRVELEFDDGKGFLKADKTYLESLGLSEDELWEAAYWNTADTIRIFTLGEMFGLPMGAMDDPEDATSVPFYVCTTEGQTNGAVALCYPEVFKDFCELHQLEEVWLVPSSTEEILIVPNMDIDPFEFAEMVDEINNSEVDPLLQLEPVIYLYNCKSNTILVAAEAKQKIAV